MRYDIGKLEEKAELSSVFFLSKSFIFLTKQKIIGGKTKMDNVKECMYFYLGELVVTKNYQPIGKHSQTMMQEVFSCVEDWAEQFFIDKSFNPNLSVLQYLQGRLYAMGWKTTESEEKEEPYIVSYFSEKFDDCTEVVVSETCKKFNLKYPSYTDDILKTMNKLCNELATLYYEGLKKTNLDLEKKDEKIL